MSIGRGRVWLLSAAVIAANVIGNLALSWGMKHPLGIALTGVGPVDALLNPWVGLGIALLAVWTMARITLLSWADLSFVLPVTSVGYVINALIGFGIYHEQISWQRWVGTALILSGAVAAGATEPKQ